jgi:serine phosphatase RsbU (regulator of sigma subunit)
MTTDLTDPQLSPWPSASKYKRSIRREFAFYVGGLVVILMIVTGLIVTDRLVDTVTKNVIDKTLVQARSYAGAAAKQVIAIDGPDVLMLTDICKKLMADNPDCGWAGIADGTGRYLAHTDMRQVIGGSHFSLSPTGEFEDGLGPNEVLRVTSDSIFVAVPVIEQGVTLGTLATASSTNQIAAVRQSALITMSLITLIMAALGVPLTAIILRRRLKPLFLITESLRKVEIGNLTLDPPVRDKNEFGFLADTLRVMGSRLEQAQRQALETDRMTRELEIAREIQSNILPKNYPSGEKYQFAGTYRSARTVGGDYYDFIDLGPGQLGIVIADVSGKSLPGMLVMLLTRDLVLKHARRSSSPAQLLSEVNRELLPEVRKGTFVTMLYGILDTNAGQFNFASAGHNPLIHLESGTEQRRLIKTKGYPLGMMGPAQFDQRIESANIQLGNDDWCILYTDGVNEAMDTRRKEYGMERFLSIVARGVALSAADLIRSVIDDVNTFVGESPQADDITLLALKWTSTSTECARPQGKEMLNATGR